MLRTALLVLIFVGMGIVSEQMSWGEEVPRAIFAYVQQPDAEFRWNVKQQHEFETGTVHQVHLVSQKWHDIVWEHMLLIYEPQEVLHPQHMLLMVTGGRTGGQPKQEDMLLGIALANLCGARIATLHQVPNQPLLGDYVEDDLITETWLKYLDTGDESWPLLFPMVKSATQAMTALEEFSKQQWQQEIQGFVITGASKRGWTSWLTPVVDRRVKGTAPIVIDTLNFPVQMRHQLASWGHYSEQIDDYTRKGLVKPDGEPLSMREEQLWKMMDPYTYRDQLTLPKLIINGTNDRYWVGDALKNYWPDLKGPKNVLMVPNAGHSLNGGREGALTTLGVFFRHVASGKNLPALDWEHATEGDQCSLKLTSDTPCLAANLWSAGSATLDFRESKWEPQVLKQEGTGYLGVIQRPVDAHVASYGELQFEFEGLYYSLTTRVFAD